MFNDLSFRRLVGEPLLFRVEHAAHVLPRHQRVRTTRRLFLVLRRPLAGQGDKSLSARAQVRLRSFLMADLTIVSGPFLFYILTNYQNGLFTH